MKRPSPSPSTSTLRSSLWISLLGVAASVSAGDPAPLDVGQVLRLSFDGILEDSSERENHGIFVGGSAGFVEGFDGRPAGALLLDGVDDYLRIPTGNGFPISAHDEFTISMWVNGASGQNDRRLFCEASSQDDAPLFSLETEVLGRDGTVDAYVRSATREERLPHVSSAQTAFDDTWHHIAWVDRRGDATLFVDGEPDPVDFSYVRPELPVDRTALGAILRSDSDVRLPYAGAIDEVRVFTRALSASEIRLLATSEPDPNDCNDNGVLDSTEIAATPSLDLDSDDVLDECQQSHPLRLGFSEPVHLSCSGEVRRIGLRARLSSVGLPCDGPGVEAWMIGLESEGCTFVGATTDGTAAAESPEGFRDGGFETTEIVDDGSGRAVVSSVVLSETMAVTLPPCEVHDVLSLELAAPTTEGPCARGTVRFSAGSAVTILGGAVAPDLDRADIDFCPCGATVELLPDEDRCVVGILRSEVPVRGGELGLAYDPSRVVGVRVEPGSDFPGNETQLYSFFDAPSTCGEEVDAGLVIGWVNHGTGELLPPGEYELFRVRFAPADGPQGGFCSELRSVSCLGVPEAPVISKVIDENNDPLLLPEASVQVCGTEDFFRRGDPNADGLFDISDPIVIVGCLFLGGDCPRCLDAADANDDNAFDISDAMHLLNWRFKGGPPPPSPFPGCGIDRTEDDLGDCAEQGCP